MNTKNYLEFLVKEYQRIQTGNLEEVENTIEELKRIGVKELILKDFQRSDDDDFLEGNRPYIETSAYANGFDIYGLKEAQLKSFNDLDGEDGLADRVNELIEALHNILDFYPFFSEHEIDPINKWFTSFEGIIIKIEISTPNMEDEDDE